MAYPYIFEGVIFYPSFVLDIKVKKHNILISSTKYNFTTTFFYLKENTSAKYNPTVIILPLKYFSAQKWSTSVTQNFDSQTLLKIRQTLLKLIHRHYSELVSQITQINSQTLLKLTSNLTLN